MRIAPQGAADRRDTDDGAVYFCSTHCAATFDANPDYRPSAHPR